MMTFLFRVILVVVSVATFAIVIQKIRRSKLRIEDSIFWVLLCVMFVIFAILPAVADALAAMLGIYSTANFLFLFMIFILLMKVFTMSLHISELEKKLEDLAQKIALNEYKKRTDEQDGAERPAAKGDKSPVSEDKI